jgi:TetR/AcrR family transcriptional regulator, regulator of cefoperazone and chloramphenicol sensitivity
MIRQMSRGARRAARSKTEDDRISTREHLLEAAGHVFAKKGFERSTAKEICERAGTNAAAVNYHFGGIEALYAAVLDEARNRILSVRAIELAVEGKTDPKEKLEAALDVIVQTLLGPVSSSWVLQVFGRDMVTPSPTTYAAKEKLILPLARILRGFVGELMGLPEDDSAVARGCLTLMAPICILIVGDRRMIKRALPNFGLGSEDAPALARHMVDYALAGLEATARKARKGNPIPGRMKAIGRKPVAQ